MVSAATPDLRAPNPVAEVLPRLVVYLVGATLAPRVFTADVNGFFETARQLGWHHLPYRDFLWEYPPLTTPVLLLGRLVRNRAVFVGMLATVMIGLEFGCLALLRSTSGRQSRSMTWFWTLTIVPLGSFAYFRLDFLSVFLATVALVRLVDHRPAGAFVAAGFGAKIWPILYVGPLMAIKRFADAALAIAISASIVMAWYLYASQGVRAFIQYRIGAGFEIESIPGALLLLFGHQPTFQFGSAVVSDAGFAWVAPTMIASFVATFATVFVWMVRRQVNMVAMLGALVLTLMLTSRILSPQYLTWVAPFVALLWPHAKRQGWLFASAAWLTLVVLAAYASLTAGALGPVLVLNLRNVVLVALLLEFFRLGLTPGSGPAHVPAHRRGATEEHREEIERNYHQGEVLKAQKHGAVFGDAAEHGTGDVGPEVPIRLRAAPEHHRKDHTREEDGSKGEQTRRHDLRGTGPAKERAERHEQVESERHQKSDVVRNEGRRPPSPDVQVGKEDHREHPCEDHGIDDPGAPEQQCHGHHPAGFDEHETGPEPKHAAVQAMKAGEP